MSVGLRYNQAWLSIFEERQGIRVLRVSIYSSCCSNLEVRLHQKSFLPSGGSNVLVGGLVRIKDSNLFSSNGVCCRSDSDLVLKRDSSNFSSKGKSSISIISSSGNGKDLSRVKGLGIDSFLNFLRNLSKSSTGSTSSRFGFLQVGILLGAKKSRIRSLWSGAMKSPGQKHNL